ncbi:nuclear transport factor 2 family protein [Streptomyces sp. NPDC002758]
MIVKSAVGQTLPPRSDRGDVPRHPDRLCRRNTQDPACHDQIRGRGRRTGGTAVSRSYVTVLQALPDLPLQPIAGGRYHDRFEWRDGQWRFVERRVRINLVGDVSRHLRQVAEQRKFYPVPARVT